MMKNRVTRRVTQLLFSVIAMSMLLTSCSIVDVIGKFLGNNDTPVQLYEDIKYDTLDISEAAINYYEYVNGNWLLETEISDKRPQESAFSDIAMQNNTNSYFAILSGVEKGEWKKDTDLGMTSRFYRTARDFDSRDAEGYDPISGYIKDIQSISDLEDLYEIAALLNYSGIKSFLQTSVFSDLQGGSEKKNRLYINGPMLQLGNKDFYNTEAEGEVASMAKSYLEAYEATLTNLFTGIFDDAALASKTAKEAIEVEQLLSKNILSVEESSKPDNYYNKFDLDEYDSTLTHFELRTYLENMGFFEEKDPEFVLICEEEYMKHLDTLSTEENVPKFKSFLLAKVAMFSGTLLSHEAHNYVRDLDNVLYGTSGYYDDDNLAYSLTHGYMGYFLGKIYVDQFFTEQDKKNVEKIVYNIIDNYEKRLENAEWLSEESRATAIEKLNNINVKIGHPKEWMEAKIFPIESFEDGGNVFKNVTGTEALYAMSAAYWVDEPVSPDEWSMTANSVNAYYSQSKNEIVFPAGILQAPFYSKDYSDSRNYGGIGVIIAHEISHAFDDTGRLYDQDGSLANWWTDADLAKFTELSQNVVDQYSAIEPIPGLKIDGTLTLGENLADISAVACITEIVKGLPKGDLAEAYESYATVFREKSTEDYLKLSLTTDPHTPSEQRVNVVLSNTDGFYETYDVDEDDPMYISPEKRIKIW